MTIQEEWRWIEGYEGMYEVSSLGRLRSYVRGAKPKILKTFTTNYERAVFTVRGKSKTHFVHRIVAKAFIPNPQTLPEVNHKNCNKFDNRASNLEWATRQQNAQHAWDNNLITRNQPKGQAHALAKFTDIEVKRLRKRYASGGVSHNQLAREYGVTKTCIGLILRRRSWTHI